MFRVVPATAAEEVDDVRGAAGVTRQFSPRNYVCMSDLTGKIPYELADGEQVLSGRDLGPPRPVL